jgi:hypothetical protein
VTTAIDRLYDVLATVIPKDGSLLQTCRFEGFGGVAYSPEPIADLSRRGGLSWRRDAHVIATASHIAIFQAEFTAGTCAIFADVSHSQAIARLWCLSSVYLNATAESELSVPSELDLSQIRGPVQFEPLDHPALHASDAGCVEQLGHVIAAGEVEGMALQDAPDGTNRAFLRLRAIVVRAFSIDGVGAALFRVQALSNADQRQVITFYVGASFRSVDGQLVHRQFAVDRAGIERSQNRPWRPRI